VNVSHSSLILISGGARSGKSRFAEQFAARWAASSGRSVVYLATSEPRDAEMRSRIAAHRAQRPASWTTVECPREVPTCLRESAASLPNPPIFILDCVTVWVANLLFANGPDGKGSPLLDGPVYSKRPLSQESQRAAARSIQVHVEDLLLASNDTRAGLVAVTNEVGLGVVPEYPLARFYRDQLGWVNQRLATAATGFYVLVAGVPLNVKALTTPVLEDQPFPEVLPLS